MNIVSLPAATAKNTDMLDAIDRLRDKIVAGEVIAFAAVAVAPDDTIFAWSGSVPKVSRLRMTGAIAAMQHAQLSGEF